MGRGLGTALPKPGPLAHRLPHPVQPVVFSHLHYRHLKLYTNSLFSLKYMRKLYIVPINGNTVSLVENRTHEHRYNDTKQCHQSLTRPNCLIKALSLPPVLCSKGRSADGAGCKHRSATLSLSLCLEINVIKEFLLTESSSREEQVCHPHLSRQQRKGTLYAQKGGKSSSC